MHIPNIVRTGFGSIKYNWLSDKLTPWNEEKGEGFMEWAGYYPNKSTYDLGEKEDYNSFIGSPEYNTIRQGFQSSLANRNKELQFRSGKGIATDMASRGLQTATLPRDFRIQEEKTLAEQNALAENEFASKMAGVEFQKKSNYETYARDFAMKQKQLNMMYEQAKQVGKGAIWKDIFSVFDELFITPDEIFNSATKVVTAAAGGGK